MLQGEKKKKKNIHWGPHLGEPRTYIISQVYSNLPLWKNNILILTVLINAGHMAIYK